MLVIDCVVLERFDQGEQVVGLGDEDALLVQEFENAIHDLVNILDVGLRSAYVASWHAAPLMVKRRRGLIAFTSSFGASC